MRKKFHKTRSHMTKSYDMKSGQTQTVGPTKGRENKCHHLGMATCTHGTTYETYYIGLFEVNMLPWNNTVTNVKGHFSRSFSFRLT